MSDAPNKLPNHLPDDLRHLYDRYIDHTMRGCTFFDAALRVGIPKESASLWVSRAEDDRYVIAKRAFLMGAFNPRNVWTPAEATLSLLRIANSETERGSTRIAAMKELNVMMGYVTLPEEERRGPGFSFDDVLRAAREKKAAAESKVH